MTFDSSLNFVEQKGVSVDENGQIYPSEIPENWFYARAEKFSTLKEREWTLRYKEGPIAVSVQECFPVSTFAVWGMSHVISPEFFIDINLDPGKELAWSRVYTFEG
ncbi:MAG: hypothetical protein PF637_00920 [Spirochaetes bacterium]|nr:hypothetical protein [Spirochaetota bacterium]